MNAARGASWLAGTDRLDQRVSTSAHSAGLVMAIAGLAAGVCALVELAGRGDDAGALAAATPVLPAGLALARRYRMSNRPSSVALVAATVSCAVAAIAVVWLPLAVATQADLDPDAALFEATAAVTGTAASAIVSVEKLGAGLHLWRALAQWAGGAGVVALIVVLFPSLGTGGSDVDGGVVTRSARRLAPRRVEALRRLLALYSGLTLILAVGFALAGMSARDSLVHALTTASTGGFSTRTGSIAAFDSGAIEAVAGVGMIVAGMSLPLLWRLMVRGEVSGVVRSLELRAYLVLVGLVAFPVWASLDQGLAGWWPALFTAASAVSTTGFVVESLTGLSQATAALVVLATGVGGMSASLAGGFTLVRVLAVFGFVRRELVRQLHADVRAPVRVGASVVSAPMANRMIGSISLSLGLLVAATAVLSGLDPATDAAVAIVDGVSIGVTSLANGGPALVAGAELSWPTTLGVGGRLTAAALMVIGRVEIYPVLVVLGVVAERIGRPVSPRRHRRSER